MRDELTPGDVDGRRIWKMYEIYRSLYKLNFEGPKIVTRFLHIFDYFHTWLVMSGPRMAQVIMRRGSDSLKMWDFPLILDKWE